MADADHHDWAQRRTTAVLAAGPARRVIGVMVASIDARAALAGKSGGLSSAADRALLKAWRAAAGGVLVGARTLEIERYGFLIPDADRDARVAQGREPWPRLLTISRRLDLDIDAVLSIDPELPLTVYTQAPAPAEPLGADVQVVQLEDISPRAVVDDAYARYGYEVLACEGGPRLLAQALGDGVLTDLSLTVAPVLVGAGPPLLGDAALGAPRDARLLACDAIDGSVFAHYAVGA